MSCSYGSKGRVFTSSDDETCSCAGTSDDSSLQVAKACPCSPCMATRVSDMFQNMSCISVDSLDIQLLSQLQMLANREKKMKKQIQEMEQREKIYKRILAQADEMWATMEGSYETCLCDMQCTGESTCVKFQVMNEQLVEENKRLASEIKEVKKEIKKCKKQISEPLHGELKNQRCRCAELEQEINKTRSNMAAKNKSHLNDMNSLQNQLNCTCRAVKDMGACNDQLRQEICQLKSKCMEVEKEIANQRISAERTRQRMHEAICEEKAKACLPSCPGNEPNVHDTLSEIGRKLSATIMEVNACFECNTLPTDLKETVKGIRNLVGFVDDVTSGKPPTSQAEGGEKARDDGEEAAPPEDTTADETTEAAESEEDTTETEKEGEQEKEIKGSKCICAKPKKAPIDLVIEAEICLDIEKARTSSES